MASDLEQIAKCVACIARERSRPVGFHRIRPPLGVVHAGRRRGVRRRGRRAGAPAGALCSLGRTRSGRVGCRSLHVGTPRRRLWFIAAGAAREEGAQRSRPATPKRSVQNHGTTTPLFRKRPVAVSRNARVVPGGLTLSVRCLRGVDARGDASRRRTPASRFSRSAAEWERTWRSSRRMARPSRTSISPRAPEARAGELPGGVSRASSFTTRRTLPFDNDSFDSFTRTACFITPRLRASGGRDSPSAEAGRPRIAMFYGRNSLHNGELVFISASRADLSSSRWPTS